MSIPLLPVLAAGHVWVLGPATPADAGLWDQAVPHTEAQLEPGEQLPGELCFPSSQGTDLWVPGSCLQAWACWFHG